MRFLAFIILFSACDYSLHLGTTVVPTGDETPPPPPGSCEGACGERSPDGCFCDRACDTRGDCCPDKDALCGPEGGTCVGNCGAGEDSETGCWCDESCYGYGDCCPDVAVCGPAPAVSCATFCGLPVHAQGQCSCGQPCLDVPTKCCADFDNTCSVHPDGWIVERCGDVICEPFALCCEFCSCIFPDEEECWLPPACP